MSSEIDFDSMNDDDFMAALEDESQNETVEEHIEDTDPQEEFESEEETEAETNEPTDDEAQDSADEEDYDFDELAEENSQAENNSEEDEGADASGSDETENDNGNADGGDQGKSEETGGELDYKAEYAKILEEKTRYENFYNEVTGEFVANGKKTKGFDDPKKIIQSQQMAAGLGEKMAAFKPYRPFMNTLKEKGMLDNPEKFNLAMQLLDGDQEALKKQMKEAGIDPIEMDMENINYVPKNQVANNIEIALDDVMESASQYGVDAQVREIISNDWDDDSVIELLEDPENSADLISHMSTGVYDIVLGRMADKRRVDANQTYSRKPKIEQYREAVLELENEYVQYIQYQQQMEQPQQQAAAPQQEQAEWIGNISNEQNEAYKASVEKQNTKTNEARRKATSLSKKKRGTRKPKQQVDPLSMDDDAFTEYMDAIMTQ